jgi:hypothetical protein
MILSGLATGLAGCEVTGVTAAYGPYDYLFFWDENVYFHPVSGRYYYYRDRQWIRSLTLPHHLVLRRENRVRIVIRDSLPYARNAWHRQRYVPYPHRYSTHRRYDDDYWRDHPRTWPREPGQPHTNPPSPPRPTPANQKQPGEEWRDYHERTQQRPAAPSAQTQRPIKQPQSSRPDKADDKRPGESWQDYHERKALEAR